MIEKQILDQVDFNLTLFFPLRSNTKDSELQLFPPMLINQIVPSLIHSKITSFTFIPGHLGDCSMHMTCALLKSNHSGTDPPYQMLDFET